MSDTNPLDSLYHFLHYPVRRLKDNKNFICVVVGQTGSGKSYAVVSMAELLAERHGLLFDVENICFTPLKFLEKVKESPKGSVIIGDEWGTQMSSREYMSVTNKMIGYLIQTMRYKNHIVFLTVPDFNFIDKISRKLTHMLMVVTGIKQKQKLSIVRPYFIETHAVSGKIYYKHPVAKEGSHVKLKYMYVPLPSLKTRRRYEKAKDEFCTNLYSEIQLQLKDCRKKGKPIPKRVQIVMEKLKENPVITPTQLGKTLNITPQHAGILRGKAEKILDDKKVETALDT